MKDDSTSDVEEQERPGGSRLRTGKVTRKGIDTSTPVTIHKGKKLKFKRRVTNTKTNALATAKRKLSEGCMVELSPSSEEILQFESTGSSLREAVNAGALSDDATEIDDERDSAAKYTPCSKRDLAAKYIPCSKRDSAAKYYPPKEEDDERDSAAKYVPSNGEQRPGKID